MDRLPPPHVLASVEAAAAVSVEAAVERAAMHRARGHSSPDRRQHRHWIGCLFVYWTVGGGGGSCASRRQSSVLESAEHFEAALLTDGSIDSGSAATTWVYVGLSAAGGGVSRRQRACWSRQSTRTKLSSLKPMAASTVNRLPSRVSEYRWRRRWCESEAVERAGVGRALGQSSAH